MGKLATKLFRRIAFIHLPHILAESEEKRKAAPLVVVSGLSPKGVVLDHSSVSKVKRGAFLRDIEPLDTGTRVVLVDHDYLEGMHERIMRFLGSYSPSVEAQKEGEYYLDLTGTRRIFGREIDTCGMIISRLKQELGFTAHAGIGSNLLIGRLASAVAGSGAVYDISTHAEREFLSPLSIRLLPGIMTGLSTCTVDELVSTYSIRRMEDLLGFSKEDLLCMFGCEGELLYTCSRGESRKHLVRQMIRSDKTLKKEIAISSECNDDRSVRRWFFTLVLELCRELRKQRVFPARFTLAVVYQDNYRYIHEGRLAAPSFFEGAVYQELLPYLDSALKRRTCMKKLVLSFSHFFLPSLQLSLFGDVSRMSRLAGAFDLITKRFGKGTIQYGA
jgi:DNA polymerase-4